MSVLQRGTNITDKSFFFLLANVSTLVADNIQVKNISSLTAQTGLLTATTVSADTISTNFLTVSSLESANIIKAYEFSSVFTYQDVGVISTLFTEHIILDQATLDVASGNVLLLNGIPIATTANLSSISDWSLEPAISTVEMLGNNILGAGNITCQNIFNALNIQTDTLSALTAITAPSATLTNIRATNISSININSSNANIPTLLTFGRAQGGSLAVSTLSSSAIFANSISTGSINGQPIIPGSNWSQYPATTPVNMNGFALTNSTAQPFNITPTSNLNIITSNGNLVQNYPIQIRGGDVSVVADSGADVGGNATINLTAQNGAQGAVAITANPGFAGVFGRVDITANGGTTGGIGTGGLVNITANTPAGFSNATSAIKINAAGVNSYAGAIPSIGSVAGYNFIYGMGGVNICAGLPAGALPNTLGTTYIYGTTGVEIPSQAYMYGIEPYWDGINTPPDLEITGRYIIPNLAQVCLRMSNVRQIYFQENVGTFISNCDNISMSSNGSISSSNIISLRGTVPTLCNVSLLGYTDGLSQPTISGYSNITTSNLTANTINGIAAASYLNTSTFQTASISSATISSATINLANVSLANIQTANISSIQKPASFLEINTPNLVSAYPGGSALTSFNLFQNFATSNTQINAQTVTINGQSNGWVKVGTTATGDIDSYFLPNATLSTQSVLLSTLNNNIKVGQKSIVIQGDVAQLQLSNTAGLQGNMNLLMRQSYGEIAVFDNTFTTPYNLLFRADNFGFNVLPTDIPGGIEFDISGNTQIEYGSLKVGTQAAPGNAVMTSNNLNISTITTSSITVNAINGYPYPWTSTLANSASSFTVDGSIATTPQLLGQITFPYPGDYFITQKVAFTKLTGGSSQDCHGCLILDGPAIFPTFPSGDTGLAALPFINNNSASTFTTLVSNINLTSTLTKNIYYYDATGNNYTASLETDLVVLHYNPGPPL